MKEQQQAEKERAAAVKTQLQAEREAEKEAARRASLEAKAAQEAVKLAAKAQPEAEQRAAADARKTREEEGRVEEEREVAKAVMEGTEVQKAEVLPAAVARAVWTAGAGATVQAELEVVEEWCPLCSSRCMRCSSSASLAIHK